MEGIQFSCLNGAALNGRSATCGQRHKLTDGSTAILISLKFEGNKSICGVALVSIRKLIKNVNMGIR